MTPGESVVLLAQGLLLLLTAWKCLELAQHRDVARLDLALLLLSLAAAVGLRWADERGMLPEVLRHGAILAATLHPLLLLRLVLHFRRVARWVTGLAIVAVAACWALLLATPAESAGMVLVVVSVIFALLTLGAVRALLQGARHAQGVVRRRMSLLAGGASVIVLLALMQGALQVEPAWHGALEPIGQLGLLLAAALYGLGLAPPPWLARAWQQSELQEFLRASAGHAGESPEQTVQRLCQTARHAVGGLAAATARWNEKRSRLELELRGERALVGGPLSADSLVAGQWTFRRPFVVDDRSAVREACQRMAPGLECGALIGVPLITPARVYGLLLVFLRRGPVLPDEDLRLLSLFAEHTAVFLDYATLVEGLRHDIARLRGEAVPEDNTDGELPVGA